MTARFGLAAAIALMSITPAWAANEVIVNETFDQYNDQSEFEAVWTPDLGGGYQPDPGNTKGVLVPTDVSPYFLEGNVPANNEPYASPPGIQGKAASYGLTGINEFNGTVLGTTQMADLIPKAATETTPATIIRLSADIFEAGSLDGEPAGLLDHRTSVRLRNDTVQREFGVFGTNYIELGHWNGGASDPSTENTGAYAPSGFSYRATIFGGVKPGGNLSVQPNWQHFILDPALDMDGVLVDPDGAGPKEATIVTRQNDIDLYAIAHGLERWHTYSVDIGVDFVTFSLDLFRDGINNATGQPGVDSTVTWDLLLGNNATEPHAYDPFTSLAFGAPSGTSVSQLYSTVDNIKLELVDLVVAPANNADFNGDNIVDGNDFLIWQRNSGLPGTPTTGDANGDLLVNALDLQAWKTQFGTNPNAPALGAVAAVPEPATAFLAAGAMLATLICARQKRA